MSPNWDVYLCLDGITQYTLDGTYRRIVCQLRCFLYTSSTHSILKVFMSGVMVIFQMTFLSSSAQAGQSLFRTSSTRSPLPTVLSFALTGFFVGNSMALVFPLFTQQMFATLTYKWAFTFFAILSLVMAPTPFVRPRPLFLLRPLLFIHYPLSLCYWRR